MAICSMLCHYISEGIIKFLNLCFVSSEMISAASEAVMESDQMRVEGEGEED